MDGWIALCDNLYTILNMDKEKNIEIYISMQP